MEVPSIRHRGLLTAGCMKGASTVVVSESHTHRLVAGSPEEVHRALPVHKGTAHRLDRWDMRDTEDTFDREAPRVQVGTHRAVRASDSRMDSGNIGELPE